MRSSALRALSVVSAAALLLTIASCSTPDGGDAGTDVELEEYTIGAYLDYSGPFATRADSAEGTIKLWVERYNETAGAENGSHVAIETYDTGYDQAKSAEVHRRALQDDKMISIIGFGSPVLLGVQEALPQDEIPLMLTASTYSFMKAPGWGFGATPPIGVGWATGIQWYIDNVYEGSGKPKVALVSFDGSSGKDFVAVAKEILGDSIDIVLEEYVPPTATSTGVNVDRIIASDPDIVMVGTLDGLQPLLLQDLFDRGFDMTKVIESMHTSLLQMQSLGVPDEVLEGVYQNSTIIENDPDSDAQSYFDEHASEFGTEWNSQNSQISSGVIVLLEAIDRAIKAADGERITGADVYAQLDAGEFETLGLTSAVQYDPEDRRKAATGSVVYQYQDGEIVTVGDDVPLLDF